MNMSIQNTDSNNKKYIPLQNESFSNRNENIPAQVIPQYPYHQPQIMNQQILQSQVIPNQPITKIYVDATYLKTSPCKTICPFCRNQIITKVNKKCNWWSCALCYFCGIATWITLQCCRNKNLNCYDAEHFCPSCGNKISQYSSF